MATKLRVNLKNPQRIVQYIDRPKTESVRLEHERALRAEYSRLRSMAQKRVKRAFEKGETAESLRLPVQEFPKLKEIKSNADLARALSQVTRWTTSKYSTAKGREQIAQKTAQSMQKLGYEGVTPQNVNKFNQFMEQMRRKYEEDTPEGRVMFIGSDFLVEAFDELRERGKITDKSNASSISRAFNEYLRETGNDDLIKKAPKSRKKKKQNRGE